MKRLFGLFLIAVVGAAFATAVEKNPIFSARAGVGTDINLGIAVGGGVGYLQRFSGMPPVDFGIDFYYYHGTYSSKEQVSTHLNTYNDTTTLMVYAVSANFLYNFHPGQKGFYFITGVGAGAVSVDWVHQSPQDTSYNDSGDYTSGGLLLNLGATYAFGPGLEVRLLAPILVFSGPLGAVGFAPMLNLAAVYRF